MNQLSLSCATIVSYPGSMPQNFGFDDDDDDDDDGDATETAAELKTS